jgi:alkylresorcinol/alkylpyrone synthase
MRLTDTGFRLMLSTRLPVTIHRRVRDTVAAFLHKQGVTIDDIAFWALHPGGPRVLEAVAESLDLRPTVVRPTWDVWEQHGNLSSATVLFVLQRIAASVPPPAGTLGMMIAFGPGVTCEMVLLESGGWLSTGV